MPNETEIIMTSTSDLKELDPENTQELRFGPGIPWSTTKGDINAALARTESDLEGFIMLLRVSAMMYSVRAENPSPPSFAGIALKVAAEIVVTKVEAET